MIIIQIEHALEVAFVYPNTLRVVGHVHLAICPFGIAAPRLHRIYDDPVIPHIKAHGFGRGIKCFLGGVFVAHPPIKRHVVRRFGVDGRTAALQLHVGWQVVDIQHDQLGGIAGLIQRIGDHHGNRFADIAHPALGKHRPQRFRGIGAIAVLQDRSGHGNVHASGFQVINRKDRVHTLSMRRILYV